MVGQTKSQLVGGQLPPVATWSQSEQADIRNRVGSDRGKLAEFSATGKGIPPFYIARGAIPKCPDNKYWWLFAGRCYPTAGISTDSVASACPAGFESFGVDICVEPCPVGYIKEPAGAPTYWVSCKLDKINASVAEQIYSPVLAKYSVDRGAWVSFGMGFETYSGNGVALETGVLYGPRGEYGYYTSVAKGIKLNAGFSFYSSFGHFNSLEAFTGDGWTISEGVGLPGLDIFGYSASQALDPQGHLVGTVVQLSVGLSVLPIDVGASKSDTTFTSIIPPVPPPPPPPPVGFTPITPRSSDTTSYSIDPDMTLRRTRRRADNTWAALREPINHDKQGTRLDLTGAKRIFATREGHIYVVFGPDDLRLYRYDADVALWNAAIYADGPRIAYLQIDGGGGWTDVKHIWSPGEGRIYAVKPDGSLVSYSHDVPAYPEVGRRVSLTQQTIGSGWNFPRVFGAPGYIYAVRNDGNLVVYTYDQNLAFTIQNKVIGTGWGPDVFSYVGVARPGELYAIRLDGTLWTYRHRLPGTMVNDFAWEDSNGLMLGWGWGAEAASSYGLLFSPSAY